MPVTAVSYYNRIDIGIYLCILEICLSRNEIDFERYDGSDTELTKVAVYKLAAEN